MAYLNNVFSGKCKTYNQDGVSFRTAIKKQVLQGSVLIDKSGVVGNEVANHKNALYAFNCEHYQYWQENADFEVQWQAGTLGENLSITGLNEDELLIGDYLHIGEVILQVSGCRTPCGNLLWRLNAPESFLPIFQQSGRSGFYLEVIKTGTIKAGDAIKKIPTDNNSISIADLALFFMQREPDIKELTRLINIPGMGQQMLSMLTALLNTQKERELVFKNRWHGWQQFTITKIIEESRQIKSFYLSRDGDNPQVAGYRAGQYLSVKLKDMLGNPIIRCWSISDYDETLNRYRISVKREPEGNASKLIHDHYCLGDKIEVMPPMGQFTLSRNEIAIPVVLISAGIGITPMVSMLKSHAKRLDKHLPTLHFIHSTQNASTHAFKNEVTATIDKHEKFHQHIIYTRTTDDSVRDKDANFSRRLDNEMLSEILSDMGCWFAEKWIEVAPFECHYYICGPEAFIKQTKVLLCNLSVPEEAIFEEAFSNTLAIDYDKQQVTANVSFIKSEQKATWQPEKPLSLLDLAESVGLTPPFSCRNGQCGLCATTLISGEVDYTANPSIEVADQDVLLCCSIPNGDIKLAL